MEGGKKKIETQDLPPEMLMEIHKCLDFKSLLRCRAVDRRWSGVGSQVHASRADRKLEFNCYQYESDPALKIQVGRRIIKTSLGEFIQLFRASQNLPFSRFRFDRVASWTFDNPHWLNFLSQFGQKVKSLKFEATEIWQMEQLVKFTEKLGELILNKGHFPNLQEFGLHLSSDLQITNSGQIPLFLFPTSKICENPKSSKQGDLQKPTKEGQLPRLKILHLDEFMLSKFSKIVAHLFCASPNLEKIEPFEKRECYKSIETFQFLQSLGKLDCVKKAEMQLTSDFLSKIGGNPKAPLVFKLKELNLCVGSGYKSNRVKALSTIFLTSLFESSKNSLEELTMDVVGYFQDLQIPTFTKLSKLKIIQAYYGKPPNLFLPSPVEFSQVFPVLHSLDLENPWQTIFPQEGADADSDSDFDSSKKMSTLTTLTITGFKMNEESIAQISARCPNLKNLSIKNGGYNFSQVGNAIWTRLTGLESLKLIVDVQARANAFPAIDSCITGFSPAECLRLKQQVERETKIPLPDLNLQFKTKRENPSILDLKDLKYFEILLASSLSANDTRHREPLNQVMNRICEDYAFKLMDNLNFNIFGGR